MMFSMTNEEIARSIKWHRENNDFKSQEVAHMLNISAPTYSKLENGKRIITASDLINISIIFKITVEELMIIPSRRSST